MEKCLYPSVVEKPSLDPKKVESYRPISRLPFPAKILERAMNEEILTFLDANQLLDSFQYGFRANHSTESALVAAEELKRAVNKGGRAVLILFDLSATFDTVHHVILIKRLHLLCFRNTALTLLSSFLKDSIG